MRVRVVTLNVWNTEGAPRRLDLINQELRRLAPDLVALQEVIQTDKERSFPGYSSLLPALSVAAITLIVPRMGLAEQCHLTTACKAITKIVKFVTFFGRELNACLIAGHKGR